MFSGSPTLKAINYALSHWAGLVRFLDDGRIVIDNNPVERSMRPIATTASYYTSSSNVRKQGLLVFHFDASRAPVTRELGHFLLFQVLGSHLVRRLGYNLLGHDDDFLCHSHDPLARKP